MIRHYLQIRISFFCFIVVTLISVLLSLLSYAQSGIIRVGFQSGVSVVCRPSYQIFLECSAISGKPLNQVLYSVLADTTEAQKYVGLRSAAIPLSRVKITLYPQIFWLLFEQDPKDAGGWLHIVPEGYSFDGNALNLWSIVLTGTSERATDVLKHLKNRGKKLPLSTGEKIFFPTNYLVPELKEKMSKLQAMPSKVSKVILEPMNTMENEFAEQGGSVINGMALSSGLQYGKDTEGEYTVYTLKRGETLYGIVVRFTDYFENRDILEACEIIKRRNKIVNERAIEPGTTIKIPIDMLSDTYLPEGKEERRVADEVKRETELMARRKEARVSVGGLKGVVVVIDPGHGGKDHGAPRYAEKIFEDEVNYDIACRLKEYLEQKTQAKAYMTVKDESQGFKPTSQRIFQHDTDEWVLVTPPHNPQDFATSANLRWLLANSIMRKEEKAGISREKMIFISIHCDVLYKSSMRGLMVYIPGANYRNGIEKLPQKSREVNYTLYNEWKEYHPKVLSKSQLIKEEVRSKTFAQILITTAKKNNIAVHGNGSAVRNVIRKSNRSVYVPSVLRNVEIPTKVLIESANLNNPDDLRNVADPRWRQKMAETIAEALANYFAM